MERIFYCDLCALERGWPVQITRVRGSCQLCGISCMGSDAPKSVLPAPPKMVGQQILKIECNLPKPKKNPAPRIKRR